MTKDINKNLFIFFFSIIPFSIILGPAISLINTVLICLTYCIYNFEKYDLKIFKSEVILGLLFFYIYLIFNSLISVDFNSGMFRNFGFIRFIIFFLAFNYFLYYFNNSKKIFKFWFLILIIFVIDVYIERFTGSNILGFGKIEINGVQQPDGKRVVSFFKDEAIAGAYISGFIFLISGYILMLFKKKNLSKIYAFLIITLLIVGVVLTGERSNSIKVFLGFFIFIFLIDYVNLKVKLLILTAFIFIFLVSIISSDYLKVRYYGQVIKPLVNKEKRASLFNHFYFKLYKSGYNVFENHPIFGVGNKNYRVETCNSENNEKYPKYDCNTHPHQIYFELLAEHGIVGMIIILSIIFYLTFRLLKLISLSKNYIQCGAFVYVIINFMPLLPSGAFFNDFNITLFMVNFSLMYAINNESNIFSKKKLLN